MKEQKIIAERIISLCKERHLSYYLLSYRSTVPITTILKYRKLYYQKSGCFLH